MIEMHFVRKSSLRRIYIKDRQITMITPEMNYQPMEIPLAKLWTASESDPRAKKALQESGVKEISYYDTDEKIAEEILKDFQLSGWRCIKR